MKRSTPNFQGAEERQKDQRGESGFALRGIAQTAARGTAKLQQAAAPKRGGSTDEKREGQGRDARATWGGIRRRTSCYGATRCCAQLGGREMSDGRWETGGRVKCAVGRPAHNGSYNERRGAIPTRQASCPTVRRQDGIGGIRRR